MFFLKSKPAPMYVSPLYHLCSYWKQNKFSQVVHIFFWYEFPVSQISICQPLNSQKAYYHQKIAKFLCYDFCSFILIFINLRAIISTEYANSKADKGHSRQIPLKFSTIWDTHRSCTTHVWISEYKVWTKRIKEP